MAKKMMILGASALQVPAIKKAKELGYEIILVDYDPNAIGFELADIKLVVSTLDQEEVYKQALIYNPDIIITSTSDGPVRTAAYVNEKMGKIPDLSYEDACCATWKHSMRKRLKEYNVPIPEYYIVNNKTEFLDAVEKIEGKVIVKPADNAGSRGVILLEKEKIKNPLEIYEFSKSYSRNGVVMVEEYMEGEEVSVEALTIQGKTTIVSITDKITTLPPHFVELGHSEPSRHSPQVQIEVKKVALQAIEAMKLINCPSHTELKITNQGPKVVEIAARLGGDFITSKLVPLSTGVDLVGNSIILATGGKVDLNKTQEQGAAIRFIQGKLGTLKKVYVPEDIRLMNGIEEVVIYKHCGEHIDNIMSSNDRLGHIIAIGQNAEEAIKNADAALEKIKIVIE